MVVGVLLAGAMLGGVQAKPTGTQTLSVEEEQQFLYYFYEAERLIRCNQIEAARDVVEFCHELNPNDATINNYMGLYAREDEKEAEMAYYFRRAYELNPKEYWYNYHVLLLQTEDKKVQQQAIKQLTALAKTDKRKPAGADPHGGGEF